MLTIPKPNAIVYPRAMMIHVQHAPVACRAVMAPLWLEHVAHQAVPAAFVLCVTLVEALSLLRGLTYPEHRDLARVSQHGLEKAPE